MQYCVFLKILRIVTSRNLLNEIAQNLYAKYIIKSNSDAIWVHIAKRGALLFRFFPKFF